MLLYIIISTHDCIRNIVAYLVERREFTHHFVENSSFCQAHAFEVFSPIQPFANLLFVCFICRNFIPSKNLSSDITFCNFIDNANGIFQLWEFYHSCPFARNKQSIHSVSFPVHAFTSFCWAHNKMCPSILTTA